jgi:hypothetical protein
VTDARAAAVVGLWQEHKSASFPARRRSMDANGVEMVTLDADVAGCVTGWLSNGGHLDRRHHATLEARLTDLARAEADFGCEERVYWQRLRELIVLLSTVD